jgi:hypothetical protein
VQCGASVYTSVTLSLKHISICEVVVRQTWEIVCLLAIFWWSVSHYAPSSCPKPSELAPWQKRALQDMDGRSFAFWPPISNVSDGAQGSMPRGQIQMARTAVARHYLAPPDASWPLI